MVVETKTGANVDYLRHSNLQITIDLNPWQWRIYLIYVPPSTMDPGRSLYGFKFLFLRINLIIDNGETM